MVASLASKTADAPGRAGTSSSSGRIVNFHSTCSQRTRLEPFAKRIGRNQIASAHSAMKLAEAADRHAGNVWAFESTKMGISARWLSSLRSDICEAM